jgi:NAD(P)-dependent dehydrogenase (short-subunit alcohol dehydrogenase family)
VEGRTVLVTGGNSGIGKETAVALARMGAHVTITARDAAKGAAAEAEIRERAGAGAVEVAPLDLASFASVRECARRFAAAHARLDVLVCNAGLVLRRRQVTEDGHETQFQVNHLGHFLLAALLRDLLVASAPARVVVVASHAHRYARGLDLDDLDSTRGYRPFRVYGRTKLMNILFTRELARRLAGTGVTANAVHPGYVASNFSRGGDTGLLGELAMVLGRPFAISSERGARTSVHVASAPELEGVTGEYFYRCAVAQPSAAARNDAAAARLWEVSAALTGGG